MKLSDWFWLAVLVAAFVLLSGLKIEFKPFKISAPGWMNAVGWMMLTTGVLFIATYENTKHYSKGYKKGLEEGADMMIKKVNELLNKAEKEAKEKETQAHL